VWQDQFDKKRTIGERCADNVAGYGGSWKFVLSLLSVLLSWMILNSLLGRDGNAWDPYPFIALNLMLSMIAAFQGIQISFILII